MRRGLKNGRPLWTLRSRTCKTYSSGLVGRLLMVKFRAILNFKLGHRRVRYDSLRIPDNRQVAFLFI